MQQGPFGLTPEERRAYEVDGFFARERVFTAAELDELRAAAEGAVTLAALRQRASPPELFVRV